MVRIKHRYLLVNILYPHITRELLPRPAPPSSKDAKTLPDVVRFHAPTSNELTAQLLLRTIREHILLLYGDYGAGVTGSGLSSKPPAHCVPTIQPGIKASPLTHSPAPKSQIFLSRNFDLYPTLTARPFSPGLGRADVCDASPEVGADEAGAGVRDEGCEG